MVRVAIYTRVSTEDQAKEGFSLDAQKDRLQSFCKAQGWDVASIYVDDGHSGRNTKRPAYQQMLADKDQWDRILVVKMDRIHRNSRNFMDMMDDLKKWEKEFVSMTESLDTSTAMGRFVMDIIQRIAQLESEQIGERVYVGMHQKASSVGGILGFNAPFGYDFKDKKLAKNENEAPVVVDIFQMFLDGHTMEKIVEDLNNRGITTKKDGRWTVWTLRHILHNPVYAGYIRWDDVIRKGQHQAIVDVKTFNDVQAASRRKVKNGKNLKNNAISCSS